MACGVFYVVGRPHVTFRRIRSSFDAPTDNYSGNTADLTSDVFGLRKSCRAAHLPLFSAHWSTCTVHLAHLPTARPNLTSLVSPRPSSRARPKAVPNPTRVVVTDGPGSSPNVYKTSPFSYLDSVTSLFSIVQFKSEGPNKP